MSWSFVRRRGFIPILLILAALAYWKLHPRAPNTIEVGYVGDRAVTMWNTLAQVRQPVAELHYGERVEVVREEGAAAQVRTASGTTGWLLDSRQMMDSDLWAQSNSLLSPGAHDAGAGARPNQDRQQPARQARTRWQAHFSTDARHAGRCPRARRRGCPPGDRRKFIGRKKRIWGSTKTQAGRLAAGAA